MACFIVPGTEDIVTTAITKIVEKKEKKEICSCETEGAVEAVKEEKVLPFSRKLRWLNNMLWGGTALLAFEHVWHGEVTPFFPFLTAAGNPDDAVQMLHEMATAGVGMAVVVTAVWVGMVAIASGVEKKAAKEAEKYGKVNVVASSADKTFSYIPDCSDLPISEDADYVYICENNTIYGTKFKTLPNTKGKDLVADVSSCFLSEPVDVTKYAMIYGGVQKNIGPAGVVIAIMREDLITEDVLPGTPTMLTYKTHADAKSLYNTPPAYGIYICGKVFKWLKKMGGLEVMKERNERKAKVLYDFLDQSKLFKGTVVPEDRSLMNVPFVTGDADLDAKFVKEAKEAGFENLKGHRTVGGMRASIYNAMPYEGVVALVDFMKKFEEENL